ncbi:MAG: pyruvate carboxylase subunit B PycB [Candidatus Syntrophoarchaeum caldarius]|uniref:Pyruvate carboxylase subunit B PycB n=1 Tax=Candidatus Syntropharchaeum caldarium TaxID=1838285 RepID=A0A1F2P7X9_9EURY|nr:MAG: pyruvate carboxylase subunit B PycB [Candidatus Syntrophoarchaeum caldarius]
MVRITDTTFRDSHQSLIATRMRTEDMLDLAEDMDAVGFFSMEVWGGATFDVCIRYLNEDPWERLRALKGVIKKTPLQMLLRGQNLVGYRHYPDDIVVKFVEKAHENGIDIFRIFDALNDIRNMEVSIKTAKKVGAHVQGTISYTISPVHTIETFVGMAKDLLDLGSDSICIKDMAGLISPADAYSLVKSLKKEVGIPIDLHSHCTSGMAPLSYYSACEAGVDILDLAFSPFAGGTSQPPLEPFIAALQGTPYDTGLDLEYCTQLKERVLKVREKYEGLVNPISERVDTNVILYQIPGGMLSNLVSQLEAQNALDRYKEVLEEVPRVRAELGYPPLVTPTSQIVGIQAVLNVLHGRYKTVTKEVRDYVNGFYGKPPGEIDPAVREIVSDEDPITVRPADLLEPHYEVAREELERMHLLRKEEDILTHALYPAIAIKFLNNEIEPEPIPKKHTTETFEAEFGVEVDGEIYNVKILPAGMQIKKKEAVQAKQNVEGGVLAPMQGMIVKLNVGTGAEVKEGDVVCVLEAMKMQNNIHAPRSGTVKEILVNEGDTVMQGDLLLIIE